MLDLLFSIFAKLFCLLMIIIAVLIVLAPLFIFLRKPNKSGENNNRGGLPWF